MSTTTTVKLSKTLRDRLAARARARHTSQAEVLREALDALDQREFWASIGQGYARLQSDLDAWREYTAERDAWVDVPMTGDPR